MIGHSDEKVLFTRENFRMAVTVIQTAPDPSSFTPLEEFQSQTPADFSEIEVLHYSSPVDVAFTPPQASPFQSSSVHVYVTSRYHSSRELLIEDLSRCGLMRSQRVCRFLIPISRSMLLRLPHLVERTRVDAYTCSLMVRRI